MKYIVYLTINKVNQKIYIGVHKTINPDKFDGYIGCGVYVNRPYTYKYPKTAFQLAVNKYGPKSFVRTTLIEFDTAEEAFNLESILVTKEFIRRNDVYNICTGGQGGQALNDIKKTYQYDSDGIFIKEYDSRVEAAEDIGVMPKSISDSIISKHRCKGFYYSDSKIDKLDLSLFTKSTKSIYQYSRFGEFEAEYDSIAEAESETGIDHSLISRSAKKGYMANDKYFSYEKRSYLSEAKGHYMRNQMVHQYSLSGEYIKSFNTPKEALDSLNVKGYSIGRAIKYGYTLLGYQWNNERVDSMPDKSIKIVKVAKYDLDGNLIEIFDSLKQCKKKYKAVDKVLSGMRQTCGGFIFKYYND